MLLVCKFFIFKKLIWLICFIESHICIFLYLETIASHKWNILAKYILQQQSFISPNDQWYFFEKHLIQRAAEYLLRLMFAGVLCCWSLLSCWSVWRQQDNARFLSWAPSSAAWLFFQLWGKGKTKQSDWFSRGFTQWHWRHSEQWQLRNADELAE